MVKFVLSALLILGAGVRAHAQTTTTSKTTHVHKTIIKDVDSERDDDDDYDHHDKTTAAKEAVITTKFGSKGQSGTMGCKTEDLVADVVKDLKADCIAWVSDQKADLKNRYLTSSCEESCEDCGSGLRRCSVSGTVHYLAPERLEIKN